MLGRWRRGPFGRPGPDLPPLRSMFEPVYFGVTEFGEPRFVPMMWRNMLLGGEPGAGKSSALSNIVAPAALDVYCGLVLLDGKVLELGLWRECADVFVGHDQGHAIRTLGRLQLMVNNRSEYLASCKRRKVVPADTFRPYLVAIDEIAYYSATVGRKQDREVFSELLRDIVARGRAVGVMVAAATQRPSSDIIPTSLRDLFAWRFAGRCTTDSSSDIVLGHGWAKKGWTAASISPTNPGCGLLIGESGTPELVKVAYLSDAEIIGIAAHAAELRRQHAATPRPPMSSPRLEVVA